MPGTRTVSEKASDCLRRMLHRCQASFLFLRYVFYFLLRALRFAPAPTSFPIASPQNLC
jgi:hypothetical protein